MNLKEQATKNLIDIKNVFDQLKVPFCLMDGTLLGAYRDNDFCLGDEDDIDLGVLKVHFLYINSIMKNLEKINFKKFKNFEVNGQLEGIGVIREFSRIDIFAIHIKNDKAFNLARSWNKYGLPSVIAYVYPAYCFKKFDKIKFKECEFNIPSKVEDFLSVRYINWKIPVARKDYDYLDIKQVPCIRKEW